MTHFKNRFMRVLNEQDLEKRAMVDSLDQGTDPGDFDVDMESGMEDSDPNASITKALSQRERTMAKQLNNWISTLQQFKDDLNGDGGIISALSDAEEGTLLDQIGSKHKNELMNIAGSIADLIEQFKAFKADAKSSI